MAAELDVSGLLWATAILSIPIVMALPMRLAWSFFIGIGHEESQYRNSVRQIIDAGRQVSPFRTTLNDLARGLKIKPSKQRLIEADLFHPLTLSHFILLPTLIIFPLAVIMALPIIVLGLPILILIEYLLIKKKLLINTLKQMEKVLHWQVIHIPKPHRGSIEEAGKVNEFSNHVIHFNYVPQGAFLGLFAWLIVHWIFKLESTPSEFIIASGLYIIMLGILGVLNTAFESDLVFVDPAKGRLVPVDQWLESILKPVVGIGLLFLIARNLLDQARDGTGCAIVHSDDAIGIQHLNQEASKALSAGLRAGFEISKARAMSWITSNPAKAAGIYDQTGSLKVGKNADVVIWSKNPFSVYALAETVFIDGALAYDRETNFFPSSDFDIGIITSFIPCLLYTSPSPRDRG